MEYPVREIFHTVNYADTDAGGVVYYARYLEYLEAGRMEYLAAIGCDAVECHRRGIFFAVREVHATYRASGRLGERLRVRSQITELSKYHLVFHATVSEDSSNRLLVESDVKCICMNAQGKLLQLPEPLTLCLGKAGS